MQRSVPNRATNDNDAAPTPPVTRSSPVAPTPSAAPQESSRADEGTTIGRSSGSLPTLHHDWGRSLVVFAGCSLLLAWIFRAEIGAAVNVWYSSATFGHAFFIFPITLFLFYRLRAQLAALQPKAMLWPLVPVAGAMVFWTIGELANLMVVKQFAFVAIWQLLFLLVFGWHVARAAMFPLAFLYLAVPFGTSAIPILQDVTAQISVFFLRLSGVPVFLDGFHIETPSDSFLVAEACSGVRFLIVSVALGVLAAYLFLRSWPRRILFITLSIIVPIIVNGIRAYGIIIATHYGNRSLADDHYVASVLFMSAVTLCLLGLGVVFMRDHRRDDTRNVQDDPISPQALSANVSRSNVVQVAGAALAIAITLSVHVWVVESNAPPSSVRADLHAPVVDSDWIPDEGAPGWQPAFHGTDAALHQGYRRSGQRLDLFVGYYAYQREGAEAVSDLNQISVRPDVKVLDSRRVTVQVGQAVVPIDELVMVHDRRQFVVWTWYWIGGQHTNSRLTGKLLEIKNSLSGGERAAAAIAVSAEVSEDVEGAVALLDAFLREGFGRNGALFKVATSSPGATLGALEFSIRLDGMASRNVTLQ